MDRSLAFEAGEAWGRRPNGFVVLRAGLPALLTHVSGQSLGGAFGGESSGIVKGSESGDAKGGIEESNSSKMVEI